MVFFPQSSVVVYLERETLIIEYRSRRDLNITIFTLKFFFFLFFSCSFWSYRFVFVLIKRLRRPFNAALNLCKIRLKRRIVTHIRISFYRVSYNTVIRVSIVFSNYFISFFFFFISFSSNNNCYYIKNTIPFIRRLLVINDSRVSNDVRVY